MTIPANSSYSPEFVITAKDDTTYEISEGLSMSVALAAVVGVPDELYQEVGFAFIQAAPDVVADPNELRAYCRTRLANYKVPKLFMVIDEMPFLPVGKVDKVRLAQMARNRVAE